MKTNTHWYGTRVSTLGVVLVATGLLLTLYMLRHFVGPFDFLGTLESAGQPRSLLLWLPAAADASSVDTARRLAAWRRVMAVDAPLRTAVSPSELGPAEHLVVAVPDGRRLSEPEAAALRRFVEAGGALVLAGALGVRGASDEWRGYDLMSALLEVRRVQPLPREQSEFLRSAARGPLAAPLAPGGRVPVIAEPGAPALDAEAELRWERAAEADAEAPRGASRRLERGSGRLVWVAAGPESARENPADPATLSDVARAALTWAAGEPVLEVLPAAALDGDDAVGYDAWRRLRTRLTTSAHRNGARRLLVAVTHRGARPVRGAALRAYFGQPLAEARVSRTTVGQRLPELRLRPGEDQLALRLPELAPGSQAWHLEWTPAETTRVARSR